MNPEAGNESELSGEDQLLLKNLQAAFAGGQGDDPVPLEPLSSASRRHGRYVEELQSLPLGTRLGDFELLGVLGQGGMGIVYRARQLSLGREVALKVLPGYARHGRLAVRRFRTEAQAAARLHHTNIVAVYAQGEAAGHVYYAMELVEGVGLERAIHSQPDLLSSTHAQASSTGHRFATTRVPAVSGTDLTLTAVAPAASSGTTPDTGDMLPPTTPPPHRTRADFAHIALLMAQVADALSYAHEAGVIHRDVKPHNILLGTDQRLHLTDFGLARLTDQPHLTMTGEVMGTPTYLSPEQVRGDVQAIDERTDIYSLGLTLYELLARRKAFAGENREQILNAILTTEPESLRRIDPRIPVDLETICLRAIDKDPRRRHQTAAELAEDLTRFAEGRPILSRRVTWLERGVRWVRRHKLLSTALGAIAATVMLALVLTGTMITQRRAAADQMLDAAYAQLAYADYRQVDAVGDAVALAARRGANPYRVGLTQALMDLGSAQWDAAIARLPAQIAERPDDVRPYYLLAWAQREAGDRVGARATIAAAETHGLPTQADAWFFRGLALHYDTPDLAQAAYREAIALRVAQHAFYPLAALHLARARNQQLYATRSLDGFEEAVRSLEQLVDQGYYEAYPYYLLSIAHRLAAEIYAGSVGTRGDALVGTHYTAALEWAQAGETAVPDDGRPVTAEAECRESMGDWAGALAARDRALPLATKEAARCETYHYRWRLRFWLGDLAGAQEDVAAHAACEPDDPFYAHVYPALIAAAAGDSAAARAHADALINAAPRSPEALVWAVSTLRLCGDAEGAQALLTTRADTLDYSDDVSGTQSPEWLRALVAVSAGTANDDELEQLAATGTDPWFLRAAWRFHAGVRRLAEGDRAGAMADLERSYRCFDGEQRYAYHARLVLGMFGQKSVATRAGSAI